MRDFYNNATTKVLLPCAAYNADNTPAAVDLLGYGNALIAISVGVGGITFDSTNKIEFKLTHSNDDSTYTAVAQTDIVGATVATGGIIKSLVAAHGTASVTKVGYIGNKRYLKLLADFSGTHGTATPLSSTLVLGLPAILPAA